MVVINLRKIFLGLLCAGCLGAACQPGCSGR